MKIKVNLIFQLLMVVAFILNWSCSKDDPLSPSKIEEVQTSQTSCKGTKSASINNSVLANKSCIEYSYNFEKKELAIEHINAGFNCCPGEIHCQVSISGDTIIVSEYEEGALCNCNCLYDLTISITTIEPESYILKFEEPYCGEQEKLISKIDLNKSLTGQFCVNRDIYPWGS